MRKNVKTKKILMIGGCGYIGSRLLLFLKDHGYFVQTTDLEWFGNVVDKRNIKQNYRFLTKNTLSSYDVIILLAGFSSVKMCIGKLKESFKNDVENFIYLLTKITSQKFIYASSSSIYGNTKQMHVTEDYDRYTPSNYYDLHKKIIDHYAAMSDLDYYGLRLGTVCGFSPHLRTDLMINKMYETALITKKITIYNPEMNRPILGLEDLCRGVKKIIEGKRNPGIYNVASFNATVGEVCEIVRDYQKDADIIVEKDQSLYNFSVDTTKFQNIFKFKFKDDVHSILLTLKKGYKKAHKTTRD